MLCSVTVEAFGFIFVKWEEVETCHHSFYTFTLNLNMALSELWKRSHFHAGFFLMVHIIFLNSLNIVVRCYM